MAGGVKISKALVGINAASTIFTRVISMIVLLGVQYYLLRRVSPEEFSVYPLMSIFIMFLPLVSNIFAGGSPRFVTLAYAKKDGREITEIISTLTPLVLAAGACMFIAGIVVSCFIGDIFVIAPEYLFDARIMIFLLVAASAIELVLLPYTAAFYALQRITLINMIHLGGELVKVVILSVLLFGVSPRVLWIAVASFSATTLVAIMCAVLARRMIPEMVFDREAVRRDRIREFLSFGAGVFVFQLARVIRSTAPVWILNRFAGPVDVTCYHLGETAYRQTIQSWIPLRKSISPPLIAMTANRQYGRQRQAYYRGGRIAMWLIMFVCTPLLVFHDEIIRLYAGDTYMVAGGVMFMLLLRFPLEMMNAMLPQLSRARARVWPLAIVSLITECASITAILLVVWGYGKGALAAAGTALLISLASELFFMWPVALRLVDGKRMDSIKKTLVPGLAPALVTGLFLYGMAGTIQPDTWGGLLFSAMFGWVVYLATGYLCLLPEDRKDLITLLRMVGWKTRALLSRS